MLKSMTGFGRYETETKDYKISVEIKSVNHRYCDLTVKMPKAFSAHETDIRNIVKEYVVRGKIDLFINFQDYAEKGTKVHYHENIAKGYMEAIHTAAESFGILEDVTASMLIRFPEVITIENEQTEEDAYYPALEEAVRKACEQLCAAREKEGSRLKEDLLAKLDHLMIGEKKIEERAPEIIEAYRKKIMDKVAELLGDKQADERILVTEITAFADKACVDEETVRLCSHIQGMKDTLEQDESIGRKLDFLTQEMNREANTILSKANDKILSEEAIELKTEIEKIREQIQNIE